jgi:hypothetical protein
MDETLEQLRYPIGRYTTPAQHTPELLKSWIADIEMLPNILEASIENLDAHQLKTPYRPDGWNVEEVVHHVADSHLNAYIRLKLALTEDNPTIKPYREHLWAMLPDVINVPVNVSITFLHALTRRWVCLLDNMRPEEWERTYFHPEHNRSVPLWDMTAMYAWHGKHHAEHILNLRRSMNW